MASPTDRTRTMLRRVGRAVASARTRAVLSFGMILGLGTVGTLAVWSDNAAATSGTFSTGTVDLRVDEDKAYNFIALRLAKMLPGESVAATLQVQNRGSVPVSYSAAALTPPDSPPMTGLIRLTVYPGGSASTSVNAGLRRGSCTGTSAGSVLLAPGDSVPLLASQGPLAAHDGAADLCFVADLSSSALSSVQGQTLDSVTIEFTTTGF